MMFLTLNKRSVFKLLEADRFIWDGDKEKLNAFLFRPIVKRRGIIRGRCIKRSEK
jgi:hypothetical protein